MTIEEGIKTRGTKAGRTEIPDVGRRQLPRFLKDMGYKVGAEIGVQRGYFSRRLLAEGLELYCIDPWESYPMYHDFEGGQAHQDKVHEACKEHLAEWIESGQCHLVQKMSMDAVDDFEDGSLDFVYIDGHHGLKYVTEDIFEWSRKVRKGGIVAGHDYAYGRLPKNHDAPYILQVKWAVDAYVGAFRIRDWWVLGARRKTKDNEKRDQYRSWFWFKE